MNHMNEKLIALTFDDGPNTTVTPLVLDALEKHNVPATFFVIGENLTKDVQPIVERQKALGCEWGNHSWSHKAMCDMPREEMEEEFEKTNQRLFEMTGQRPSYFRPPYIAVNQRMSELIPFPFCAGIGCEDWKPEIDVATRVKVMLEQTKAGDIYLLHDMTGNVQTALAVDILIPELKKQGYEFVTISELFKRTNVNPDVKEHVWYNAYDIC